nr:3'-5' exonuclease [Pontibacillus yanchengensis]
MDLSTAPFTIFDLETTGLLPEVGHEIISIGAIRIHGTQHIQYERFHQHIYPIRPVPNRTLELTGMSREDLRNGHSFCDAYYNFLKFSKDSILVAYPAAFDMNFLQTMLKRWKLPVKTPHSLDAQSLVKHLYPNKKFQLDNIITELGICKLDRHHALNDATMTAELFQKLLQDCINLGIKTPGELIQYAQKKS